MKKNKKTSSFEFISIINALRVAPIIIIGDGYIEVPGIVTYVNSKLNKFMFKLISINSKIIQVDEEEYADMITAVFKEQIGVMLTYRRGIMKEVVRINIILLSASLIRYKESRDTVIINTFYFSSNLLNFHGLGMFSGLGRNVFLLNKEELDRLKVMNPESKK